MLTHQSAPFHLASPARASKGHRAARQEQVVDEPAPDVFVRGSIGREEAAVPPVARGDADLSTVEHVRPWSNLERRIARGGVASPALSGVPACPLGRLVDIGDTKMYCEIHGTGKPVLVLNGGFQTSDDYRFLVDRLTDHHQLLLIDHRGRGRTGDGEGEITYPRIADDVVKMLDQLGLEKVSLVGHSEGGCVALELMRKYPERVEAAALIGTPLEVSEADRRWFATEKVAMMEKRFDAVLPVAKAMYDSFLRLAPDPSRWATVVDKIYTGWGQHRTWTPQMLGQLHTPTLVFRTENDPFIPVEMFDRAVRSIPGARCCNIPEGRHNLPMSHPDEVTAAITSFLDEVAPGAS